MISTFGLNISSRNGEDMTRLPSCSVQNIRFIFCACQLPFPAFSSSAGSASLWLNINDDLQFRIYLLLFSLSRLPLTFISCMRTAPAITLYSALIIPFRDVKHAQNFSSCTSNSLIWNADLSKWQFKDLYYVFYYYALYVYCAVQVQCNRSTYPVIESGGRICRRCHNTTIHYSKCVFSDFQFSWNFDHQ